ncbi:MAG: pyridoxamine 5'-phosphate oxidase [Granulosicoccus sp.]|nr:pyridoxamine 5'-phosphate oxidase [Granulosicoccus sp.]
MTDNNDLIEERRDYTSNELHRRFLKDDPLVQFTHWLEEARAAKLIDATAMHLSTVDAENRPHSRIVLLKGFDENGFIFYSNYDSDKGRHLQSNPNACLLFYWKELERQVRIEGNVKHHASSDADTYFHSRPTGSRFSAAASNQSRPVANRAVLEKSVEALHTQYPAGDVPRPDHWGGFLLQANYFEFWQGRADRLHDRFSYTLSKSNWAIDRLAP